jgi:Protein of unknown function (DUF3237)
VPQRRRAAPKCSAGPPMDNSNGLQVCQPGAVCAHFSAETPNLDTLATPTLRFFADLSVLVGPPQEVGQTAHGQRRLIPILGGSASGNGWTARVLQGGADFQLIVHPGLAELDARYCLETDAGDLIYVQNRAIRTGPPELIARLVRGEPVDPSLIYFRCTPSFETASSALHWITERLFLGTGARHPQTVVMRMFEIS